MKKKSTLAAFLFLSLSFACVYVCGITITCLILIYLWHVSRRCVAVDRLTHRRRRRRLSWHWNKSFAFVGGAINLVRCNAIGMKTERAVARSIPANFSYPNEDCTAMFTPFLHFPPMHLPADVSQGQFEGRSFFRLSAMAYAPFLRQYFPVHTSKVATGMMPSPRTSGESKGQAPNDANPAGSSTSLSGMFAPSAIAACEIVVLPLLFFFFFTIPRESMVFFNFFMPFFFFPPPPPPPPFRRPARSHSES